MIRTYALLILCSLCNVLSVTKRNVTARHLRLRTFHVGRYTLVAALQSLHHLRFTVVAQSGELPRAPHREHPPS